MLENLYGTSERHVSIGKPLSKSCAFRETKNILLLLEQIYMKISYVSLMIINDYASYQKKLHYTKG